MSHLNVLARAVSHHGLLVLGLDDYGHTLLRLADGQFCGVESAVLGRNPVKIYVKTVGKFADRHADTTGTEVVGFLYKSCHLRTAEKPLEFPFLRCVTLLHLTSASLERLLGVLL